VLYLPGSLTQRRTGVTPGGRSLPDLSGTLELDYAIEQRARAEPMQTTFKAAVESYLRAKAVSHGTRNEYFSTLRKWERWGGGVPIEELQRKDVRAFLDWVYERAVADEGTNPGRTANKAREHLRAVVSWAWEQELIESPPRFPKPREQRDVAGRHYLTKAEINALYFATHSMPRPRGWYSPVPIGRYWRAAWSCSSTTASILAPSGSPRPSTSRFSGGTCRGSGTRQTVRSRNSRSGGGSSTAA
jgi:hypothetical protein